MAEPDLLPPSFSAGQRWSIRIRVLIGVVSMAALLGMLNYLSLHYFKRFDLGSDSAARLSPQTLLLLRSLTNEVRVTIFFNPQSQPDLYSLTSRSLGEYQNTNPRYVSLRTLNYSKFDGEARAFLTQHHITSLKAKDFVLFESGTQSRLVYARDLSEYDIDAVLEGRSKEFRRKAFRGEMLFSAAVANVTFARPMRTYFLEGHGEQNPEETGTDHGYSKFAALLKDEVNAQWARLDLRGTNGVPADCQLLIVAGPRDAVFTDTELGRVQNYLQRGGRLLALLNNLGVENHSGLERVLARWGVGVSDMTYEDRDAVISGQDLLVNRFSDGKSVHPIVAPLATENLGIKLSSPRVVFPLPPPSKGADSPNVDLVAYSTQASVDFKGRVGSLPLVVAVEQGSIKGVSLDHGNTRIVVIGDALCFNNPNLDAAANHYFASLTLNWLLDRPQFFLSGLGAQPIKQYKLLVTDSQMTRATWILLVGLPGAPLLLGGLVWLSRRR